MDAKRVGALISAQRRAQGMTQQQLADRIGVTNRAVSKWETGQGLPDIDVLPELAQALGCTVDELLAGKLTGKQAAAEEQTDVSEKETSRKTLLASVQQPVDDTGIDAATDACCTRPVVRWPRILLGLIGLGGIVAGCSFAFSGLMGNNGQALRSAVVLFCGLFCCQQAVFAGRLRRQIAASLRRNYFFSVSDEGVLWEKTGRFLPLESLSSICIRNGYTILVWDRTPTPATVAVPDAACTISPQAFMEKIQQIAPVAEVRQLKAPTVSRRVRAIFFAVVSVILMLPAAAVALGITSCVSPTGKILALQRDAETGVVTDLHTGNQFPYPVVGRMKEQWLTGDCCAVTYQTIDGSTHVYLATYGDRGSGLFYYYVESALYGSWRENESVTDPGYQLRHDAQTDGVQVTPPDRYGWTYSNNVQFGTIGLALCDSDGLPQWVVVLGKDYTFDESDLPSAGSTIVLCPVSMDATTPVTLTIYTPEQQQSDMEAAEAAARPSFWDTVSCDVTPGGIFFTWDGGLTTSNPISGNECEQYGITEVGDIQPLVLRENGAAFLMERGYNNIWVYSTKDRGQTWNSERLFAVRDVRAVSDKLLDFVDDSFGYAAISTEYSPGAGIAVSLFTTNDGGETWQEKEIPFPDGDRARAINGLSFADEKNGIASLESGQDNDWPYLFVTTDGGETWQSISVPWTAADVSWLRCLDSLTYVDGRWCMKLTQYPQGMKVCTFQAEQITGPWTYEKTEEHTL